MPMLKLKISVIAVLLLAGGNLAAQDYAYITNDLASVRPTKAFLQLLKSAVEEDRYRKKAVTVFINETARTEAVVDPDGWVHVGRDLMKPYKMWGSIASQIKAAEEGYEINFQGNLTGFDHLDMEINSGLKAVPRGPLPTQILFRGVDAGILKNASATFLVTPAGVSLTTIEKLTTNP